MHCDEEGLAAFELGGCLCIGGDDVNPLSTTLLSMGKIACSLA